MMSYDKFRELVQGELCLAYGLPPGFDWAHCYRTGFTVRESIEMYRMDLIRREAKRLAELPQDEVAELPGVTLGG
jgi:hypothetical protein